MGNDIRKGGIDLDKQNLLDFAEELVDHITVIEDIYI